MANASKTLDHDLRSLGERCEMASEAKRTHDLNWREITVCHPRLVFAVEDLPEGYRRGLLRVLTHHYRDG